jgi:alpha-L-rhamnosidase
MIRRLFILVALLMPLPAAAVIAGSGPVSAAQIHLYAAQQASQAGPADFVYCVNERSTCTIKGTADIAFGANGNFYYAYGVTGNIPCTDAVFGDPDVGVEKACYIHQDTGPTRYSFCVSEGRLCTFSGHANVAFGADGKFHYKSGVTGNIPCTDAEFGDPDVGVEKACYVKSV